MTSQSNELVPAARVALFGGSFNPIHHGHLIAARSVAEHLNIDRVVLIPSATPPHKQMNSDLASAAHRLEMLRLAVQDEPHFEASDIEIRRTGPSYTIDTVEAFRHELGPAATIYWIIGGDTLPELHTWRLARDLVDACTIVTAVRPGYQTPDLTVLQPTLTPAQVERLQAHVLATPLIDISATSIRRRVRERRSIRYCVPETVRSYIEERGLYRDECRSPDLNSIPAPDFLKIELEAAAPPEQEWHPLSTMLFAAFQPDRTARHTQHVSLFRAFAIHVLAAILILFAIAFAGILSSGKRGGISELGDNFFHLLTNIGTSIVRRPAESCVAIVGTTLGIESAFLLIAFLIMPWGARVEKLRASFAHALRRTWLQTPHIPWAVLIVGLLVIVPISRAESDWRSRHQYPSFNPPVITPQMTAEQQQALNTKATEEYSKAWEDYQRNQPFLVRRGGEITSVCVFAAAAWFTWALLRAVGISRSSEQIRRPPTCEFCGYDLSTMKLDSRCPECGQLVIESLGDDVRLGTSWQNRGKLGWLFAYLKSSALALRSPRSLGRQLRLYTPGSDHRLLVIPSLLGIALITCLGFCATLWLLSGNFRDWLMVMLSMAGMTSGVGLLLILAGAASIGLFLSLREQRNLLPGAVQASAYLSLWLIIGDLIAWASGVYLATEPPVIHGLAQHMRMDWHIVAFFAWFPINLVWFAWWARCVWSATVAVRYANR